MVEEYVRHTVSQHKKMKGGEDMEILRVCGSPAVTDAAVIALGFFDGLHIGHAALLEKTAAEARARGVAAAVFTFADSPGFKGGLRLYPEGERLSRFADFGIERVYVADFSALAHLSPEEFVRQVLIDGLHAAAVVCGFNYRFGAGAAGDATLLSALLTPHGVPLFALPPTLYGDKVVSTSLLRATLGAGDVGAAMAMLGRPYSLSGRVVRGKALGRTIGIPTANIPFPDGLLVPRRGVYFVSCELTGCDRTLFGLANVGVRPTVEKVERENCEVHFLSEVGDLYGKDIRVSFLEFLRPEERFADLAALGAQIALDKQIAKEYMDKWNGQS